MNIAIIGAGMSGLACAGRLSESGLRPVLFDKSRGVGGRMATRRMQTPLGEATFDHGCRFFTAETPDFQAAVQSWSRHGLAEIWTEAGKAAWVGVPGMNAIARHMAQGLDVRLNCHVTALKRSDGRWFVLSDGQIDGPFDIAVLATPAQQAAPMLSLHDFAMARLAASVSSAPCWTAMIAFSDPLDAPDIIPPAGALGWAARNNAKPGRNSIECWVIQASPSWSQAHLEQDPHEIQPVLLDALASACPSPLPPVLACSVHRWRYAEGTSHASHPLLFNEKIGLGACGDWLLGKRAEDAWVSGTALADTMLSSTQGQFACGQRHIA